MKALRTLGVTGVSLLLLSAICFAQSTATGTVSGQVTDNQGDAVADAEIILGDVATNTSQRAKTNESGRYTFVNVEPGIYDLSITKTGFKLVKISGEKVRVGLVLTVNVMLEVGSVTETAVVMATGGTELQTTNATVGTTVSGRGARAAHHPGA
jgi:hypothetical protein